MWWGDRDLTTPRSERCQDGVPHPRQHRNARVHAVPRRHDLRQREPTRRLARPARPFVERGGNFVDTADVYSRGRLGGDRRPLARDPAGDARPDRRSRPRAASRWATDPTTPACRARHLDPGARCQPAPARRRAIDLYQAHAWDPLTPIEETLGFFDDAVRAGKIRYAGVSNFLGWQLQKAVLTAALRGLAPS